MVGVVVGVGVVVVVEVGVEVGVVVVVEVGVMVEVGVGVGVVVGVEVNRIITVAKKRLVIELPIPMPTWNRLLAMHPMARMECRHLIHQFVSLSFTHGRDWPTSTVYQGKPQSTDLLLLKYLQTIRPNKSWKSSIDKLKDELKAQPLSSRRSND